MLQAVRLAFMRCLCHRYFLAVLKSTHVRLSMFEPDVLVLAKQSFHQSFRADALHCSPTPGMLRPSCRLCRVPDQRAALNTPLAGRVSPAPAQSKSRSGDSTANWSAFLPRCASMQRTRPSFSVHKFATCDMTAVQDFATTQLRQSAHQVLSTGVASAAFYHLLCN